MNKKEIINSASCICGISKLTLNICLEAIIKSMSEAMNEGHSITISNFGTFRVVEKTERYVMNPRSKQMQLAPAKKRISFKTSPGLFEKDRSNTIK